MLFSIFKVLKPFKKSAHIAVLTFISAPLLPKPIFQLPLWLTSSHHWQETCNCWFTTCQIDIHPLNHQQGNHTAVGAVSTLISAILLPVFTWGNSLYQLPYIWFHPGVALMLESVCVPFIFKNKTHEKRVASWKWKTEKEKQLI